MHMVTIDHDQRFLAVQLWYLLPECKPYAAPKLAWSCMYKCLLTSAADSVPDCIK